MILTLRETRASIPMSRYKYDTVDPVLSALLSGDEVHRTGRNCLIVIPDPECVGGGLGRACAVPWLPAGRV